MTKVLLIDDERKFIDNRECTVARTAAEAIEILKKDLDWDEVWFDFTLLRSDIMDVLFHLETEHGRQNGPTIRLCRIHSSSGSGRRLIEEVLLELKYKTQVEDESQIFYVDTPVRKSMW
jgi:hypothetical protein